MHWHLTLASFGRENLFPTRKDRVAAARLMTRTSAEVLLFCAVDDHLHLVVEAERAGHLGGALGRVIGRTQPAHVKPVESRRHLLTLVDYLLRQPARHDLGVHPALWEGSCFPDLVGARTMGFDTTPLHRALPRMHHRDWLGPVGLREPPRPLPWEEVVALGAAELCHAVEVAAGLDSLRGSRIPQRVRARSALAWMAQRAGLPAHTVAAQLGLSERSVFRLRPQYEPPLCTPARTWLHLERLCQT